MEMQLILDIGKQVTNKAKGALGLIYMKYFQPHLYSAQLDYRYTDEKTKYVHLLEAMNYCRVAGMPRVYFEFGCHSARTFSAAIRAARCLGMHDAQFYAFDSFQGLPEVSIDDTHFVKGQFCTTKDDFKKLVKKNTGLTIPEQNIIEGFYNDSLTFALQETMPKVGVVHIDVDLYASTVDVLAFIRPLLVVGSVLLFDDWYCYNSSDKGERYALHEFCEANPQFGIEAWKAYSTFGKSFFVTSLP